jgi:hypothetical protein
MKLGNGGTSQYYDSANISSGQVLNNQFISEWVDSSNMTTHNYQPANLFRDAAEMVKPIAFISMKGTHLMRTLFIFPCRTLPAEYPQRNVIASGSSFVAATFYHDACDR